MQVHVDEAVHTTLRKSGVQNRARQHELHLKLSKAVGSLAPPVIDDACRAHSFFAGLRPVIVDMPASLAPQRGSPATVAEVAEHESGIGNMPLSLGTTVQRTPSR